MDIHCEDMRTTLVNAVAVVTFLNDCVAGAKSAILNCLVMVACAYAYACLCLCLVCVLLKQCP